MKMGSRKGEEDPLVPPFRHGPKPIIGLVGGMGSGKSLVAELLAQRGACTISGDQAGHEALRQPEIKEQVIRRWGHFRDSGSLVDEKGEIRRTRLAALVFANPEDLRKLEAIVFPWIRRRLEERILTAELDSAVKFIVLDAAVMLEAGWNNLCDRLVFVDTPRETRLQRLAAGRGWTAKEVQDRERVQLPLTEKSIRADAVLENSGSREQLAQQVDHLLKRWGLMH
jgi:dephospho-CoA kinase